MTRREWLADGMLVLTAMIWGTGFVVMKNTLDSIPPEVIRFYENRSTQEPAMRHDK